MARARRAVQSVAVVALLPLYLQEYFRAETGRAYGVDRVAKVKLLARMVRTTRRVQSASNFVSHLFMATKILNLPPDRPGVLVECGCFKGASTANLSIVAKLVGRKLHVFDSFEGLPEPDAEDRSHVVLSQGEVHTYEAGHTPACSTRCAPTSRPTARSTCASSTRVSSRTRCRRSTSPSPLRTSTSTSSRQCARASSICGRCCRTGRISSPTRLITSTSLRSSSTAVWWREQLGGEAPGLVGAGSGIGIIPDAGGACSSVGYTVKNPAVLGLVERPQER